MPYYAVSSGNIFRCVEADTPLEACTKSLRAHIEDRTYGARNHLCNPSDLFEVAELDQSKRDNTWLLVTDVAKQMHWKVEDNYEFSLPRGVRRLRLEIQQ